MINPEILIGMGWKEAEEDFNNLILAKVDGEDRFRPAVWNPLYIYCELEKGKIVKAFIAINGR